MCCDEEILLILFWNLNRFRTQKKKKKKQPPTFYSTKVTFFFEQPYLIGDPRWMAIVSVFLEGASLFMQR